MKSIVETEEHCHENSTYVSSYHHKFTHCCNTGSKYKGNIIYMLVNFNRHHCLPFKSSKALSTPIPALLWWYQIGALVVYNIPRTSWAKVGENNMQDHSIRYIYKHSTVINFAQLTYVFISKKLSKNFYIQYWMNSLKGAFYSNPCPTLMVSDMCSCGV